MRPANVFVLGLDELNLESLQELPHAEGYRFHPLLGADELIGGREVELSEKLKKAQQVLDTFAEPIDAIVGYWDFPVSSMVPILCRRYGLPGAPLEAVVKCEHKYWSRLEQQKVIDEHPRFALVDLDGPEHLPEDLDLPIWLKPVKSMSSELAFRIDAEEDYPKALEEIREGIDRVGRPFEHVLEQLDLPSEIAEIGGRACLAEEAVSGQQVTVEGYAVDDRVEVYAVIDSHTYPDSPSFLRYEYPTRLPADVLRRLEEASSAVIRQVGLTSSTFNIEYFWDSDTGVLRLLEVNPRHSQSHAKLFEYVDGVPNHQAMVRLGLGQSPELPRGAGEYDAAAKWFLRRFSDGVVRRVPTEEEIAEVEQQVPGLTVQLNVQEGDRLSELPQQDSYSYELADLHIGGRDQGDLIDKYERCRRALRFKVDD